ncbi:DUF5719 family protein [Sinosporangium siamense]|uniref:Secreted protein n=1 Tax=Sinosporangium siamense TaxID=1367973 RepID=A0A919RC94_9ACTN|nr:DUF5719 family protein [Sinosporangium siamense]GII91027.1 hypothetical protein Ssi02_12580 [Sinosporangium siamense]
MKSLVENRFGLLALVLVALLAMYGVAYVTRPAHTAGGVAALPPSTQVPVDTVTTVCPAPSGETVSVVVPVAVGEAVVGSPTTIPAQGVSGVTVAEFRKEGDPLAILDRHGQVWHEAVETDAPLKIFGTGEMAGLESAYTSIETKGKRRGLSATRCADPVPTTWMIGPGPAAAAVTLHLSNPGTTPVTAEILVYSGEGPVYGETDNVVTLQPGENHRIDVAEFAPSALVLALEVRASGGRVAAMAEAVLHKNRGVDWMPHAAAPATRVVVPGVPGGGGGRELLVAAPGQSATQVEVKTLTEDGLQAVSGREVLDVPAGSVATMELSGGLGTKPGAVVITSRVPVVAGVVAAGTGSKKDTALTAGALPIDLGSVVADNRTEGKQSSHLVLSAPQTEGRVLLQMAPREGAPSDPVEVRIPAARTVNIELPHEKGASSPFAVVVTPLSGSGPVYGGRILEDRGAAGLMLSVQPLAAARSWTLVPSLTESTATVMP